MTESVESVLIASGDLTKGLDRLEEAGFLGRHPDPDDRRATLVRLTPAGRDVIDDALSAVLGAELTLVHDALDGDTVDTAADALRQLVLARPES